MTYLAHTKFFLFRLSHSARFRKTVQLINPQPNQTILDYGCADGRLLKMLIPSGVRLLAYDPAPDETLRNVDEIELIDPVLVDARSCDVITICEVFEHVDLGEIRRILSECRRLLKPDGKVIVSVPLEVGLSSLVKSFARWARVRPLEIDMTVGNVLRSVCYLPFERFDYGGTYGHMGFDFLTVERILKERFTIIRREFSPLPLRGFLNSQVFYELR